MCFFSSFTSVLEAVAGDSHIHLFGVVLIGVGRFRILGGGGGGGKV